MSSSPSAAAAAPSAAAAADDGADSGAAAAAASASGGLSEYEQLRQRNILRNNAKMESLGLTGNTMMKKRKRAPAARSTGPKPPPRAGTRSSKRIKDGGAQPNYKEPTPAEGLDRANAAGGGGGGGGWDGDSDSDDGEAYVPDPEAEAAAVARVAATAKQARDPPPAESSRALHADAEGMLEAHLGNEIPGGRTKAVVMKALGRKGDTLAKFSKYQGAVEWKNCVVLWVNVDAGRGATSNVFKLVDDSLTMSWYGSKVMHAGSPVIGRILATAAPGSGKKKGGSDVTILFCRDKEDSGQYLCCGRVVAVDRELARAPVRITWRLLDWEPAASLLRAPKGDLMSMLKRNGKL